MRIKKSKSQRPRVYLQLKDAVTSEIKGITIEDANLPQVLKRIREAFSDPPTKQPVAA